MDMLCLGETLIDFKATGTLAFQGYPGGSPMNVAIAAARLEAAVGFASQASSDQFGSFLRRYIADNGVDTSLLEHSDAPSTLAFVSEIDGEAHFDFMANGTADSLYDPQPRPVLPASVKVVFFGSISLLQDPAAQAITDIVRAHRDQATVVFDPNVRPALIADRTQYLQQLPAWLELCHIAKVSTQDLRWLYPEQAIDSIAAQWLAQGVPAVIITQGSQGASLYRQGQEPLQSTSPQVDVVDTVGAGDTFSGALMVELLTHSRTASFRDFSNDTWQRIVGTAIAAAAYNCTQAGANPPTRQALDDFMAKV